MDSYTFYEIIEVWNEKTSLKRSISARTAGRAKRVIKKALIPGYDKKEWDG